MELTKSQIPQRDKDKKRKPPVMPLIALLAVAVFFYISIIYKIINYGP